MTYDAATQTEAPALILDGAELKIGDEVIIAHQPADPWNDGLWTGSMRCFVGRRGVVDHFPVNPRTDVRLYGAPSIGVKVDGGSWWFRLSELSRPATEFPDLVAFNETTGPGALHPACLTTNSPYNADFLDNEGRLCPYDNKHGTLSLRPGYDAYLTRVEFQQAQLQRRERFYEWRNARALRRATFKVKIRDQLELHPFGDSSKGRVFSKTRCLADKLYYAKEFAHNHKLGRDSARVIGKLMGHFHPTRPRTLSDDEVFVLLQKCFNEASWRVRSAIFDQPTHPVYPALRAVGDALGKLGGVWRLTPWHSGAGGRPTDWFYDNEVALARMPHISTEKPQEVAYYQSVDKLLRGIETRTKPGRFLAKFYPNLTPDQVRQYANDYLVATAPKQLHIARTRDEIIMAINEGPGESCQSRHYYDRSRCWYRGHIHPAAAYASGDFEVLYITDDNKPGDPARLAAETQRITARVICNAKDKLAARIYGDHAKLTPLLDDTGYEQKDGALVGCRLLRIYDENDSGSYIMPYVDAGTGSGGGCLYVGEQYDHDSGREVWVLSESGEYSTYAGYDNKGLLDAEEGECYTCERCDSTHDIEDEIHYSEYEGTGYCSCCEDDFVYAVTGRSRLGNLSYDMVLQHNAVEIGGEWYVDDPDLLGRCGFVQCVHCDEWAEIDDTTTTDSGMVCCDNQLVELAEESPDGNEYGYRPDCTQYVDVETGGMVWLDDNTDVDDFTTEDDTPKYVSLDVWREMQQRQAEFEFVGPPKHNPAPIVTHLATQFDDLRI